MPAVARHTHAIPDIIGLPPIGAAVIGASGLATLSIVGTLTFAKVGTTARTVTFPDAAIAVAGVNLAQSWSQDQTLADVNVVLGTATGTKLGTAVGQKLGLWGATPVMQPSGAAEAAVAVGKWARLVSKGTSNKIYKFLGP